MKKPSASLAVSTLALAVALTGTASATGLIDGRSIRDHSIPASKLIAHSLTTKQVKAHSLTKLALDPNAVTIINNISAAKGDKGEQGPAIVGQSGTPGADGKPGTPGANSPRAFGIVTGAGTLVPNTNANLTVRKPGPPNDVGIYCVSTPGYTPSNSIAIAQPWGSQVAQAGYVGAGSACNGTDEFQIDVLDPNTSTLIDSIFSVVIA